MSHERAITRSRVEFELVAARAAVRRLEIWLAEIDGGGDACPAAAVPISDTLGGLLQDCERLGIEVVAGNWVAHRNAQRLIGRGYSTLWRMRQEFGLVTRGGQGALEVSLSSLAAYLDTTRR